MQQPNEKRNKGVQKKKATHSERQLHQKLMDQMVVSFAKSRSGQLWIADPIDEEKGPKFS